MSLNLDANNFIHPEFYLLFGMEELFDPNILNRGRLRLLPIAIATNSNSPQCELYLNIISLTPKIIQVRRFIHLLGKALIPQNAFLPDIHKIPENGLQSNFSVYGLKGLDSGMGTIQAQVFDENFQTVLLSTHRFEVK